MKFFKVKCFETLQHYKDRNPPWIKLHYEWFDNYNFSCLQDASKLQLILIFMLASRSENILPWDENWLTKKLGVVQKVDLEILKKLGFIEEIQSVSNEAN